LFDGKVFYDECLGEHLVADSVVPSPELSTIVKGVEGSFQFISSCSEDFADLMIGLLYGTLKKEELDSISKTIRGLTPYERKLFAFLSLSPASSNVTKVTTSLGEKKLRVNVHTNEKIDASIFTPVFTSEEVDYLILGKNFYFSVKKDEESADKKITF